MFYNSKLIFLEGNFIFPANFLSMGSILILIVFVICVFIYIKIMKKDENKQEIANPDEPYDDSHMPDFAPYLDSRIGREEEDDEDEPLDYDGFMQY